MSVSARCRGDQGRIPREPTLDAVDFVNVSAEALQSSPIAPARAAVRAQDVPEVADWVHQPRPAISTRKKTHQASILGAFSCESMLRAGGLGGR